MKVLVTAASKHGATAEIADAIAGKFRESAIDVEIHAPDAVDDVVPYDAVVIGSAVYAGHWLEPARRFVDRHATALASRPTWLFSSGPIGRRHRRATPPQTTDRRPRCASSSARRRSTAAPPTSPR